MPDLIPKPGRLSSDEQRAQATAMMVKRLFGDSLATIADAYGVTRRTVERRLAAARLDGVPDAARQVFIDEMLPQSMAVLQEALRGDDMKLAVQVAIKVVDGLKVMEAAGAPGAGAVEESLEVWRATRTVRVPLDNAQATGDPLVIDALPAGEAEVDTAGDPGAAPPVPVRAADPHQPPSPTEPAPAAAVGAPGSEAGEVVHVA